MKPRTWRSPPTTDRLGRIRGARYRGRHSVPPHAHPLVRQFFGLLNAEGATQTEVAAEAGLSRQIIKEWRRKSPQLVTFEAALNVLGFRLAIERVSDERSTVGPE